MNIMKTFRILGLALSMIMCLSIANAQYYNNQINQNGYPNNYSYSNNNQGNYNQYNNGNNYQYGYNNNPNYNPSNNGYQNYNTPASSCHPRPRVMVNVNFVPAFYQGYYRGGNCHQRGYGWGYGNYNNGWHGGHCR